jgi:hypothetical protein
VSSTALLELSKDAKQRIKTLQALSEKVEGGDKGARKELRKAVRESAPEVICRASDISRRGRWVLIKAAAANDPLTEEALLARVELISADVAGPDPSALEVLLTEMICSLWVLIEVLELLMSAQLSPTSTSRDHHVPAFYLRHILKWQESASRRFLAATKVLVQVRRLQSGIPNAQTNVQINLSATGERPGERPHD